MPFLHQLLGAKSASHRVFSDSEAPPRCGSGRSGAGPFGRGSFGVEKRLEVAVLGVSGGFGMDFLGEGVG